MDSNNGSPFREVPADEAIDKAESGDTSGNSSEASKDSCTHPAHYSQNCTICLDPIAVVCRNGHAHCRECFNRWSDEVQMQQLLFIRTGTDTEPPQLGCPVCRVQIDYVAPSEAITASCTQNGPLDPSEYITLSLPENVKFVTLSLGRRGTMKIRLRDQDVIQSPTSTQSGEAGSDEDASSDIASPTSTSPPRSNLVLQALYYANRRRQQRSHHPWRRSNLDGGRYAEVGTAAQRVLSSFEEARAPF